MAVGLQVKNCVEHFVDVSAELNMVNIAERIVEDGVQVLVNLMGHTRASDILLGVHSLWPSPIQAVHMGYAATMGASFVTTTVTDPPTSPPEYQADYTEKHVYMPYSFFPTDFRQTYPHMAEYSAEVNANNRKKADLDPKMPEDKLVLCVFNQRSKIDPSVFATWMNILKRVPNAIIWMLRVHHTFSEARLEKEARKVGVDPARLWPI